MTIGFYSYFSGFLANCILAALLLTSWSGHQKGRWLIAASFVTGLWAGVIALQEAYGLFETRIIWIFEVVHAYVWLAFFSRLLYRGSNPKAINNPDRIRRGISIFTLLLIGYIWAAPTLEHWLPVLFRPSTQLFGHIVLAVTGLVLIEQYYRNARTDQRWRIKFLCFALGTLFIYDFYLYSDALMFERVRSDLWVARGAVAAFLPPLIAISAARNPDWSVDILVSRQVVFHSVTLLGGGGYLLLMAFVGYYINIFGGKWGSVLQIVFLVGAFLVLMLVLFSGAIRASIRVFLNKHFFNYIYDYRQEWLRLIATLSDADNGLSLEERLILALGQVVESPSGILWGRESTGRFTLRASYGDPDIDVSYIEGDDPIIQWMSNKGWVVNLPEMIDVPELYQGVDYPSWLRPYENPWLLVPLLGKDKSIECVVLLTRPRTSMIWNWEVLDMLKATSRLAMSYLALEDAARELAEARQFDGFNRLSAFVIHDLKNLIAQLTLVVRNAEKHQDNPEFMADAIKTVDHAVGRMNALMSQLRNANPAAATEEIDLAAVIHEAVEARKKQSPAPEIELCKQALQVQANRARLASAIEHVIHNGQDAVGKHGQVRVRLRPGENRMAWVEIEDNGSGMDRDFIRKRLFKPFETTKGLTGMGIGAYESREYARSLGGELDVFSEPGKGSLFRFSIPLLESTL